MSDMTARDVADALHRRYNRPSQGKPGEQYICLEEARSGAGFQGNNDWRRPASEWLRDTHPHLAVDMASRKARR